MAQQKYYFLEIPQGCYGEITPEAAAQGNYFIYTKGIETCCHVLVYNTQTNHTILCHADVCTNLADPEHGIKNFIEKVCPNRDWDNLKINIGEDNNYTRTPEAGKLYYYPIIQASVTEVTGNSDSIVAEYRGAAYSIGVDLREGLQILINNDYNYDYRDFAQDMEIHRDDVILRKPKYNPSWGKSSQENLAPPMLTNIDAKVENINNMIAKYPNSVKSKQEKRAELPEELQEMTSSPSTEGLSELDEKAISMHSDQNTLSDTEPSVSHSARIRDDLEQKNNTIIRPRSQSLPNVTFKHQSIQKK